MNHKECFDRAAFHWTYREEEELEAEYRDEEEDCSSGPEGYLTRRSPGLEGVSL